jgi:hypothetical protein
MKDQTFVTKASDYYAWEADREERDLDEASRSGLQLVHGGCFHSRFRRDSGVVYRYRIDYRTDIPDMMDYRAAFEAQGWEYLNSTFNGWHYFRKLYDPALPESEYEIYTDRQSYAEMQNRWMRLIAVLGPLCLLIGLLNIWLGFRVSSMFNMVAGGVDVLIALLLLPGVFVAKRKREGKKGPWLPPARMILPLIMLFLILAIAGAVYMGAAEDKADTGNVVYRQSAAFDPADGAPPDRTFTVDKTGFYTVDYALDSGGAEVTFQVTDGKGSNLVDITCSDLCDCGNRVRLKKGETYTVRCGLGETDGSEQVIILASVWG